MAIRPASAWPLHEVGRQQPDGSMVYAMEPYYGDQTFEELHDAIARTYSGAMSHRALYERCCHSDMLRHSPIETRSAADELAGVILHIFYLYQDEIYTKDELNVLLLACHDTSEATCTEIARSPYPHHWPAHVRQVADMLGSLDERLAPLEAKGIGPFAPERRWEDGSLWKPIEDLTLADGVEMHIVNVFGN